MSFSGENVCYLLWKLNRPRESWVSYVSSWAKCDTKRAEDLLRGAELHAEEQSGIARALDISEEDLQYTRMVEREKIDILRNNMNHLLSTLVRGQNQILAKAVNVHYTSITKWKSGETAPSPRHQESLRRFFQISNETDLAKDPIFLSPSPVLDQERRSWLHNKIDQLSGEILKKLFPALEKLLRDS